MYRQANRTLQLDPIPNPYPVPDTAFSLDFQMGEFMLVRRDVVGCINYAYSVIVDHINQHGDTPIPRDPAPLKVISDTVEFSILSIIAPHLPVVSYSDTLAILRAFAMKMSRNGYRSWFALIVTTEGGDHIGGALITQVQEESLQLQPIPNPYPVPGTDITVDFFEEQPVGNLDQSDTTICIYQACNMITNYITAHGDGPISLPLFHSYKSAELEITPHGLPGITYNQSYHLLQAFTTKMGREGYLTWLAEVFVTEGNIRIADALIYSNEKGLEIS